MVDKIALKDTLNLPKTKFPMQAQLVKREQERLQHWEAEHLYACIQQKNIHGPLFVLHDGPPFTNGNVHIGTALNKILKDMILRFKSMQGFSTPFIPGWDCHGLPIEHKVAKEHPELLKDPVKMRSLCDQFSDGFIKIQEGQFKRLGILADWENAYRTKNAEYEANVLRTFSKFVKANLVYRSKKPVYWSIPCKTALAEAEIEYQNHRSTTVWVKFLLKDAQKLNLLESTYVVIWTTTPWTLPANRAIALSPTLNYVAVQSQNECYIVAEGLVESFVQKCQLQDYKIVANYLGKDLEGLKTQHPFLKQESPLVLADYVTLDAGTGCVHTAPGHGMDDYITGLKYHLDTVCPVDDNGCLMAEPWMPQSLIGLAVLDLKNGKSPANDAVIALLKEKNALMHEEVLEHSYPHCWRSKTPVLSRALPQWFIYLDGLKKKAKTAIDNVQWIPSWGKNRISGSVEARPDWCISRQRTWGIPLPIFYNENKEALLDGHVIDCIADKIEKHGSQWWFESDEKTLLEGIELPDNWKTQKITKSLDTLDVWIDSGCSHYAVLATHGMRPADLYLEGSDQHRGWFQSSLMTSLIDGDKAPYKTVLTHGFFVDENRKKISKSDGSPQTAEAYVGKYGADILRLWIASEDYRNDIPVSENILQHVIGTYRTIRNTLRFQLGNLFDFNWLHDARPINTLTELDRWVLHETNLLVQEVTEAYKNYEFHKVYQSINRFCTLTLSARYHDILKDRLYTLGKDWPERRSSQTAIYLVCSTLLRLLAPILTFTADEAWGYLWGNSDFGYEKSIHLAEFPVVEETWSVPNLAQEFKSLFDVRERVQAELEKARQQKIIGQSLDAKVTIQANELEAVLLQKHQQNLAEYFIVSEVILDKAATPKETKITVAHADGVRCPRTWRWVKNLVEVDGFGPVSERCAQVLKNWKN